ncbi:MAG: hypothetical protein OZ921_09640 [Sorangiineae bacterium]|nr:hypothetical protein [Polyangiaceae bacterium]MEB2322766.1 hypothetical protein [Sorangiineae bacterium]
MARRVTTVVASLGALALVTGCSWSRFDDVSEESPVVLLKRPGSLSSGFGFGVAALTGPDGTTELISGGPPGRHGAAVFRLGSGDQPRVDASDTGQCKNAEDPCYLAASFAGIILSTAPSAPAQRCFVSGIGSSQGSGNGLVTRCDDTTEFVLAVPPAVKSQLIEPAVANGEAEPFVLRSDKGASPALVAGAENQRLAWFYAPGSTEPVELVPPGGGAETSYGAAVVSLRSGAGRIFAVSAPAAGHVWLFRSADGATVESIGCLGGAAGFGRALGSGFVDADDKDELVIADERNVTVLDGKALASLAPTSSPSCGMASLPAGALVASFGCGATPAVSGCDGSGFGASVDVGDLDGDGDGEIIVGAPRMSARDVSASGAVLIYDVEGDDRSRLSDVKFISSAETGDALGSFVAAARVGTRDIIAAGAPGTGKTALFYCTSLLPPEQQGARCQ